MGSLLECPPFMQNPSDWLKISALATFLPNIILFTMTGSKLSTLLWKTNHPSGTTCAPTNDMRPTLMKISPYRSVKNGLLLPKSKLPRLINASKVCDKGEIGTGNTLLTKIRGMISAMNLPLLTHFVNHQFQLCIRKQGSHQGSHLHPLLQFCKQGSLLHCPAVSFHPHGTVRLATIPPYPLVPPDPLGNGLQTNP